MKEMPSALKGPSHRYVVQRHHILGGWETWVIYDEKNHADNECARRISEALPRDKKNWRVIPEPLHTNYATHGNKNH